VSIFEKDNAKQETETRDICLMLSTEEAVLLGTLLNLTARKAPVPDATYVSICNRIFERLVTASQGNSNE
jgi:hypothetical protein